jgi:RNA polymerase sigma factor (sigma-70 family)
MTEQAWSAADEELVAGIQAGHSQAETAIYEKYASRVYYLALRESRSTHDAEDVRAETFLRVLQAIRNNQVHSKGSLPSFILGTTRNVLHELFHRRRQRGVTAQPEEAVLPTPPHEELFLETEVRQAIEQTIARLKPRERVLLRLHFYEELTSVEIARQVGIAPERVRLVKSRALRHFREVYQRLDRARSRKKVDTN